MQLRASYSSTPPRLFVPRLFVVRALTNLFQMLSFVPFFDLLHGHFHLVASSVPLICFLSLCTWVRCTSTLALQTFTVSPFPSFCCNCLFFNFCMSLARFFFGRRASCSCGGGVVVVAEVRWCWCYSTSIPFGADLCGVDGPMSGAEGRKRFDVMAVLMSLRAQLSACWIVLCCAACACVYACVYVSVCACVLCMYLCVRACVYVCACVRRCMCMRSCMCTYVRVRRVCMCVCDVCVCACVCMCVSGVYVRVVYVRGVCVNLCAACVCVLCACMYMSDMRLCVY